MTIYISMLLFLGVCAFVHSQINVSRAGRITKVSRIEALLPFIYIMFWIGIRDAFGDTTTYIQSFKGLTPGDYSNLDFTLGSGWGFDLFSILFKTYISSDYHAYLMFIAVISGTLLAVTFRNYSENYYYTVFLFLATTNFTWMMNGIRQFLAVCILFASTPLLVKKKWIRYILIVLMCSTIHATSLLMLPIAFVAMGKPWGGKTLLVMALVIFATFFTAQFTDLLNAILEDTSYSGYGDQFASDDGVSPLRWLIYSVPAILAYMGHRILWQMHSPALNIMINMSIVTSALYAVGVATSGILIGRLPIYTQLYGYILLPTVIDECFTKDSRKILYAGSVVAYLFFFYMLASGYYYSSTITGYIPAMR